MLNNSLFTFLCNLLLSLSFNYLNNQKNNLMKKSELSFADGFNPNGQGQINRKLGIAVKSFDWDKAAQIIKEKLIEYPNLYAEAGLQGDWNYTGGEIFGNGKPTNDSYTCLAYNWALPTLLLYNNGDEIAEIECSVNQEGSRFNSDSKWDDKSLKILGIELSKED